MIGVDMRCPVVIGYEVVGGNYPRHTHSNNRTRYTTSVVGLVII